jgi:hypothetical protein
MTPLFKKLNPGDQRAIHVLNVPDSFEAELSLLDGVTLRHAVRGKVDFAIAFVTSSDCVTCTVGKLVNAAEGDALLWMAYPKTTSKQHKCEFNRDTGWASLGAAGYEPVRQVAIDEDWSALRFRKVEFIKAMTRKPDGAISEIGRQKARATKLGFLI